MKIQEAKHAAELELTESLKVLLRKAPRTVPEIAAELGCPARTVERTLRALKAEGSMIHGFVGGKFGFTDAVTLDKGHLTLKADRDGEHRYGFVTDTHLCNMHSRLDVLNEAYDFFASEGITKVLHAGNMVDGEMRFNKTELIVAPGMQSQIDYAVQEYPARKGVKTYFIDGDDHEGWYYQREKVQFGKLLQNDAKAAGRDDLVYLGYGEADIALAYNGHEAVARLVHPGGGSAYAISYTDQKRVESYQGGEKPQIEWVGHYHKFNYGYPREVHTHQGGCTCDQTMFLRKKRIQAMVGFNTIGITQSSEDGSIIRYAPEWFPRFDRGYYEKRF
ncbi:MAG TPA: helix-turn-helix domain-containing protein [Acidobacteriaceae bacterium]|jgi:hypothetical protein